MESRTSNLLSRAATNGYFDLLILSIIIGFNHWINLIKKLHFIYTIFLFFTAERVANAMLLFFIHGYRIFCYCYKMTN